MFYLILDCIVIYYAFYYLKKVWNRHHRPLTKFPYPPGPKGLPIIGYVLDMPGSDEWEAARKWGEEYGECASQDRNIEAITCDCC